MTDTPTPPTDERLTDERISDILHDAETGWFSPAQCRELIAEIYDRRREIHTLTIRLTDQEHELIATRAERDKAARFAVGVEHDYAGVNADLEEMRERGERLCTELEYVWEMESRANRIREAIDGWRRLVPPSKPAGPSWPAAR